MESVCSPYVTVISIQTQEIQFLCFSSFYIYFLPNLLLSLILLFFQVIPHRRSSSAIPLSVTGLICCLFFSYFLLITVLLFLTDSHNVSFAEFLSLFINILEWLVVLYCYQGTFALSTWGCSRHFGIKLFWLLKPLWAVVEFVVYWTNFGKSQQIRNSSQAVVQEQALTILSVVPFAFLIVLTVHIIYLSCKSSRTTRYQNLVDDSLDITMESPSPTKSQSKKPNSYERASIFSKLVTGWIYPVLRLGWQRPLETSDVEDVRDIETTAYQKERLRPNLEKYLSRKNDKHALLKAMYTTVSLDIFLLTVVGSLATLMDFSGALFIKFVSAFLSSDEPLWKGYAIVTYMVLGKIVQAVANNHYRFQVSLLGAHVKSGLSCHIFDKTLNISPSVLNSADSNFTYAQVINLMQVDLGRISEGIPYSIRAVVWPVQFGVGVYLIYATMGWQALVAGLVVMVLLFGINGYWAKKLAELQKELMQKKDARMKVVGEWLGNMKVLKLYNWENKLAERVSLARNNELTVMTKAFRYMTSVIFLNWGTRNYLIMAVLITMTLCDLPLTPGDVFAGSAVIGILNMSIRMIPDILNNFVQSLISFKRIQDFLQCREIVHFVQKGNYEYAIDINSASFTWELPQEVASGELKETKTVLKDIDMKVRKGETIAVVGRVGSGKSSLIQALIQNLGLIKTSESSHVAISGSVAYVSQEAWIQNTTIKKNILFGNAEDTDRYREVIRVCQLEADLDILPAGDSTEIGEKGINLSGGQKTRVAIARAVYADADVYLLDDPLSAVDAHVGSEIFYKCFKSFLQGKTVLLVTNNQQFLPYVDRIVMMNEGKVMETGTYKQLLENNGFFKNSFLVAGTEGSGAERKGEAAETSQKASEPRVEKKIIEVEDRAVGSVKLSVYKTYIGYSGGLWMVFWVVFFMLCWQGDRMYTDLFLSEWTDQSPEQQRKDMVSNIVIYSVASFSVNLFILFRLLVTVSGGIKAARTIFEKMITALVNAPVNKFYDVTPTGRILNRLSKDQNAIDMQLLFALNASIGQIFQVFCIICLVAYIVPYLLIAIPFAMYLALKIQNFYLSSSRELMRLESISRSPVVQNFTETVNGLSIIRAFGSERQFSLRNEDLLNKNTALYFYQQACNCWLGIALEIVSDIILTGSCLFIVSTRGSMNPGLAGVCLSYAITLPENIYFLVFASSFLENQMVSVERCHQLAQTESEASRSRFKDPALIERGWPQKGGIEFENYQMKYREDTEIVLKGVTGKVKGREKIGIVGRTGSGKSSICLSLFRIIEPYDGRILIDGVDIEEIGLDLLRQKICVIPQEPTLFQSSLRDNLDPFHEHSDERLVEVLRHVDMFAGEEAKAILDKEVTEGGSNFSAGQRQLICIARALLRNSKIIFLDEATASVDYKTDGIVQEVIKKEFKDCTVLTIAHRINTIMDYDRIIVMDQGVIAEFDTPDKLIEQKGIFYSLVNKNNAL